MHVLDRPRRQPTFTHLLRDQGVDMLWGELGEPHPAEGGEDVKPNEVLVTSPRHWPCVLLGDLVLPSMPSGACQPRLWTSSLVIKPELRRKIYQRRVLRGWPTRQI